MIKSIKSTGHFMNYAGICNKDAQFAQLKSGTTQIHNKKGDGLSRKV